MPPPAFTAQVKRVPALGFQIVLRTQGTNSTTVHRDLTSLNTLRAHLEDKDLGAIPRVGDDDYLVEYFCSWLGAHSRASALPAVRQFLELPIVSAQPVSAAPAKPASMARGAWPRWLFLWAAITVLLLSQPRAAPLAAASQATANATSVSSSLPAQPQPPPTQQQASVLVVAAVVPEPLTTPSAPTLQAVQEQWGTVVSYAMGSNAARGNHSTPSDNDDVQAAGPIIDEATHDDAVSLETLLAVQMPSLGFAYASELTATQEDYESADSSTTHDAVAVSTSFTTLAYAVVGVFVAVFLIVMAIEHRVMEASKLEDAAFSHARDWFRQRADRLPEPVQVRAQALIHRVTHGPSPTRQPISMSEAAFHEWSLLDGWTPSRARLAFVTLVDSLRNNELASSQPVQHAPSKEQSAATNESFDSTDVSDEPTAPPTPAHLSPIKTETTPIVAASQVLNTHQASKGPGPAARVDQGWSVEAMVAATALTVVGATVLRRRLIG